MLNERKFPDYAKICVPGNKDLPDALPAIFIQDTFLRNFKVFECTLHHIMTEQYSSNFLIDICSDMYPEVKTEADFRTFFKTATFLPEDLASEGWNKGKMHAVLIDTVLNMMKRTLEYEDEVTSGYFRRVCISSFQTT